jgi:hypothetical protein
MEMKTLAAALRYFAIVFGTGLVLGPLRVWYVEPRVGVTTAVLLEAPVLLVAMLVGAKLTMRWMQPSDAAAPLGVGLLALAMQQIADVAAGVLLRGMSLGDHVAHFATPPGMIYAALLVAFVVMPWLIGRGATGR